MSIVNSVQDDNAYQAWVKLLKKYETDEGDIQELEWRWTNCKLEDFRTDPDTWFLDMDHLNQLLGSIDKKYKKDELQISAHIFNNMCEEYSSVVTSLETSGATDDIQHIQDSISKHWKKNQKKEGPKSLNEAFFVSSDACTYCGKKNHKYEDCFKRLRDSKNKELSEKYERNRGKEYEKPNNYQSGERKCWLCGGDHLKSNAQDTEEGTTTMGIKTKVTTLIEMMRKRLITFTKQECSTVRAWMRENTLAISNF